MANKQIRIKFVQGNVSVELEGDSSIVMSELKNLKKNGIGKLTYFFVGDVSRKDDITPFKDSGKSKVKKEDQGIKLKDFPSLGDIVLKDLPKSEPEWIVMYSNFASNGATKTFSRDDLLSLYTTSGRLTTSRRNNLSNSIKQAVTKNWISQTGEETFTLLPTGIEKAKEIVTRTKAPKKKAPKKGKKKKGVPKKETKK